MARDEQTWVNVVLGVVLVCTIVGGVFLYNDLSALEGRVDTIEVRSRALDVRLQSIEMEVEAMKTESSSGIVDRVIDAFILKPLRFILGFLKSLFNMCCGIIGITISA